MDEKYIQELYSGLGGTEVLGDYKDFYNLITNDDTYIQDIHSSFGEETLGDYNDFYNLVKKKDEPGDLPTKDEGEDTSSVSDTATTEAGLSDASALTEDKDVGKTEEVTEQITEEKVPEITAATAQEYEGAMRKPLSDTELAEIEEELTEEFEESGFKDTIGKYYNALKEKADESKGDEFAKWVFSKFGDYKTYKQEAVAKAEKQLKEEGGGVIPPLEQIVERAKEIRRNDLIIKKKEYNQVEFLTELADPYRDIKSLFLIEGMGSISDMPINISKQDREKHEGLKKYNKVSRKKLGTDIRVDEANLSMMSQNLNEMSVIFNKNDEALKAMPPSAEKNAAIDVRNENLKVLQNMAEDVQRLANTINDNKQDLQSLEVEADLLKRNYDATVNSVGRLGASTASLGIGIWKTAKDITDMGLMVADYTIDGVSAGTGMELQGFKDFVENQQKESLKEEALIDAATEYINTTIRGNLRKARTLDDLESFTDWAQWTGDLFADQIPQLAMIMASGGNAGLYLLAGSAYGNKLNDMEKEMSISQDVYNNKVKELNALPKGSKEHEEKEKELESLKKSLENYDFWQLRGTAAMVAAGEFASEKVTQGILKRAMGSPRMYGALGKIDKGKLSADFKRAAAKNYKDKIAKVGAWAADPFMEGGSEVFAQINENIADKFIMGKDVGLWDHVPDAFVSGLFIGGGIKIAGGTMGLVMKDFVADKNKTISKNLQEIKKLTDMVATLQQQEQTDVTKLQIDIANTAIAQREIENGQMILGGLDVLNRLSADEIREVSRLNDDVSKIRDEYRKISEATNITEEQKAGLIEALEKQYNDVVTRKDGLMKIGQSKDSRYIINNKEVTAEEMKTFLESEENISKVAEREINIKIFNDTTLEKDFAKKMKAKAPITEEVVEKVTAETIDANVSEDVLTPADLIKDENTFTHVTRSIDAMINWIQGGQVLGRDEKLEEFETDIAPTEGKGVLSGLTAKHNANVPNFQKGGIVGGKIAKGVKYVVVRQGAENFTPNLNNVNQASFERSKGVGVLNPANREIENFEFYKVTPDGNLQKINVEALVKPTKAKAPITEEVVEEEVVEEVPAETIKVFRGVGKNIGEGVSEGLTWVSENKEFAEDYAAEIDGKPQIQEMEIEKPKNIFEIPYNPSQPMATTSENVINKIRKSKGFKENIKSQEQLKEIKVLLDRLKDEMGDTSASYRDLISKPKANKTFAEIMNKLGYDAVGAKFEGVVNYALVAPAKKAPAEAVVEEVKEEVVEEVVEEVAEDAGDVAAEYRKAKEDFLKDNPDTPQSVIDVMDNMIRSAEELDAKTKEAPIEEQAEPYEQWLEGYKERTGQFLKENPDLGQGAKDAINNMMKQAEGLQEKASKDRVMEEVGGIIEKVKERNPNLIEKALADKQLKDAVSYLEKTKWYEQATAIQREAAIREVKKLLKVPVKRAPSVSKLFKIAADKVIEVTDKQLRSWMTKDLAAGKKVGIKETKAQQREAAKIKKALKDELSKELNAILKEGKGKLTIPQVRAILNKFDKMNILNETKREAFIDYTKKVLKKAEYVEQISKANKLRKRALKNIKTKIGTAQDMFPLLKKLFAINPTLIPLSQLNKYFDIVNEFGSSARVLNLKEKGKTSKDANNILNIIAKEVKVVEPEVKEKTKDIIDLINKPFLTEDDKNSIREKAKDFTEATLNKFDRATLEELAIILKESPERKMVDEYIAERGRLTQDIIDDTANIENLDLQDEQNTADRINDLTKEDLNNLDGDTLNNIMKIKDNIENGVLPHAAIQILTEVESNRGAAEIIPSVKKIDEKKYLRFFSRVYGAIKDALPGKKTNPTLKQIESNPPTVIDQIYGNLKNKNIFNNTFGKLAKKWSSYESQQAAMDEKYDTAENLISSQFLSNPNKIVKSRYKIMAYLLQQEYQANEGNSTVAPALDFINETIKAAEKLSMNIVNDYDARILQEIKDEFTVDGKIDANKIKDSLSKKEKKALEIIEEANASLGVKALYTSSVIRGNRVDMLNNYVHHQVISEQETKDFLNQQEQFVNPSTKAKNLLQRTSGAKPINFDPISSGRRASRMTLLDYNMTEAIKTVRKTVKKVKQNIDADPKATKLQKEGAAALEKSMTDILELIFNNQFSSLSGWDKALTKIKNIGYYAALASVPRAAAELSSNYLYGMISSPKELSKGITTYMDISLSADSVNILQNVGSSQTKKLYGAEPTAGKYADTGIFSRGKDVSSSAVNDVKNAIFFIHNNSTKRLSDLTTKIAGGLISFSDKALSRPLWLGTFATKFKEVSGKDVDFSKIRNNDAAYMKENKEAIDAATLTADEASVRASTTTNPFESIMKNMPRNEGATKKMLRAINSYMARFSLYEYTTARTAIYSMMGVGELSPAKGAALMMGVTARMSAYVVLYNVFKNAMYSLFGVAEDDEEDIEDLMSRQIVGSAVSLFTRRTLGNLPMMPINILIEKANEKFLEDLRDGKEYDPYKHSIVFSQISPEDFGKYGFEELILRNFAGPVTPQVRSAARAYDVIVRSQTAKKPETRQKYIDEMTGRMAIEALGNLNLLPFYKDIRSIIVKDMFKDSDKKKKKKTSDNKNWKKKKKGVDIFK